MSVVSEVERPVHFTAGVVVYIVAMALWTSGKPNDLFFFIAGGVGMCCSNGVVDFSKVEWSVSFAVTALNANAVVDFSEVDCAAV